MLYCSTSESRGLLWEREREGERERERERLCVSIYIYVERKRERVGEREREGGREGDAYQSGITKPVDLLLLNS